MYEQVNELEKDQMVISDVKRIQPESKMEGNQEVGGSLSQKNTFKGFPGDAVIKNLPANAGTRVQALVQEYPTCHRATKPVHHNY